MFLIMTVVADASTKNNFADFFFFLLLCLNPEKKEVLTHKTGMFGHIFIQGNLFLVRKFKVCNVFVIVNIWLIAGAHFYNSSFVIKFDHFPMKKCVNQDDKFFKIIL